MVRGRQQRRLVLSPTRIQAWLDCQLQYKLTYIDRLSRFYYKPNRFDSFGASMHRALQKVYESGGLEMTAPEDAVAALDTCWASAGYSSSEEEEAARDLGRTMIADYHRRLSERRVQTVLIEKQLRWTYDTFTLMGRLDRMDEHPDGTLEIIDYKSLLPHITPEEVRSSIAMTCYALLARRHYPDRPVRVSIVSLAAGCEASAEHTDEELEVFEEQAHTIARGMQGREEFLPSYGPLCESCIYSRLCYKGGPVDWEARQKEFEEANNGAW